MSRRGAVRLERGLLAEFATPEALTAAVERLVADGYVRLDTFTPYPVRSAQELLRLERSRIPLLVFAGGCAGAILGYGVQWWTATDYPLIVGGFAPHSAPANVPITFESTVLVASVTALLAFLVFCGLPRLWHPVFEVEGFESATIDRFWVGIDATDPRFDLERSAEELRALGALRVVEVGK